MKNVLITTTAVLFAVTFQTFLSAQEEMAFPQPSPEHEILKLEAGNWQADMKMWMEGPEGEATASTGTEVNTMIGEFWSASNLSYEMMGMPVHGHGVFGYDPGQKKYVGTWYDSVSPYLTKMEGEYDAASKTMTWQMAGKNPDGSPSKMKAITVYTDDDHKTFTMSMPTPGDEDQWIKFLEVEYTRTK